MREKLHHPHLLCVRGNCWVSITDEVSLPKPDGHEKERRRSSRVAILAIIVVAVLIVSAVAWLTVKSVFHSSGYTEHSPISITGDGEFTKVNGVVRGSGTASDPYIIAGWEINASGASGIFMNHTDAHVVIRNCYVHGGALGHIGIFLSNCVNSTLENNICSKNDRGISLYHTSDNALTNNTCNSNLHYGILLDSLCSNNKLTNNDCTSNGLGGIDLWSASNNILINNNCSDCLDGMELLSSSNNNTLISNNCSSNSYEGILLSWAGNNNDLSDNLVSDNAGYGVDMEHVQVSYGSFYESENFVWNNTFIGNNGATRTYDASHVQACDNGTNNSWNSTAGYGNYWSDWTTPDANQNGIVDQPYNIAGDGGAKDYYPLTTPP